MSRVRYGGAMARAKVDPSRTRSAKVEVRCKPDEKADWDWAMNLDRAASLSEWIREMANERVRELREKQDEAATPTEKKRRR
jgi:hypothetical protein